MAIFLNELDILEWLWHDAKLHFFSLYWNEDGELQAKLRCQINYEESREPLFKLGIKTLAVDVNFHNVWRQKLDIRGDITSGEVVEEWKPINPSPLILEIKSRHYINNLNLLHHQIKGSGGSVINIVFEKILLAEVNE